MRRFALLLPLLLVTLWIPLYAQGDTITRNPKCVQLKRVWKIEGAVTDAYVGAGVGSVGDINGDSIGDFAVYWHIPNYQWAVFYGGSDSISTTPVWTMDTGSSGTIAHPVVGDFWGTGHHAVGFMRSWLNRDILRVYNWLRIFRTDSNRLEETPSAVWYSVDWKDTSRPATVSDALACDLDGDGDDELICVMASVYGDRHGELWIYNGGPEFRVDTPSVVIRDPLGNNHIFRALAGDLDGDKRIDLVTIGTTGVTTTCFYWGANGWPARGRLPDRTVVTGDPQDGDGAQFATLVDCDGDGIMDVMTTIARIWRSGSNKKARMRSWTIDDADIYLRSAGGPFGPGGRPGYLNSKRYEMVATGWSPGAVLFSGGPDGPDLAYDATYYPSLDGLQGRVYIDSPVGDVTGDGWDDAIGSNHHYPTEFDDRGIAVIIAGGPYIPSDDPAVGVRHIGLENRSAAISLWPNPAREELNIAWRGDLKRMPRRFEIHDMQGRLVASGSVPEGDPAALWRCGGQPSGAYLLSVFDAGDHLLATTRFIKL